ncbi:MAG: hypothetical protein GC136_07645 [Alphaproteobacteria bacterium]|nr:hypothetical protein [Alphaproteobacteria bacterium]
MPDLTKAFMHPQILQQAEQYAAFFQDAATRLYGEGGLRLNNTPPDWQPATDAIKNAFAIPPWAGSTQWEGLDHEVVAPMLNEWLGKYESLSVASYGWAECTGVAFDAVVSGGDERRIFTIIVEPAESRFFERTWCPFVQQPCAQEEVDLGDFRFTMREAEAIEMLDFLVEPTEGGTLLGEENYPPAGYKDFLNNVILRDTPFVVTRQIDICVLRDGTPLFAGFDPIQVRVECKAEHEKRQWDASYQQEVMAQIARNCEGLPEILCPVVRGNDGNYMLRQDVMRDVAQLEQTAGFSGVAMNRVESKP